MAAFGAPIEELGGRVVGEEIGDEHELERQSQRQRQHRQPPSPELDHLNNHLPNGRVDFREQEMPHGERLVHSNNGAPGAIDPPAQEVNHRPDNAPLRPPRVIPERPLYEVVANEIILPWSGGRVMIEFAASLPPLPF
uniref:Uncharacterized protein n=1 Tax=Physcomitrium patens TaxID=3218 RepID=A9SL67_PHYPA|nr:hypothetical protein PHYPA_012085 [Physcomitrium patens]